MTNKYNKVCITFEESDIHKFTREYKEIDSLLFVGSFNNDEYNVTNIKNAKIDEQVTSKDVKNIFNNLSLKYGIEINAYANNFFQSTLVTLLKYISSIDILLEEYNINEIVFPNNIFLSTKKPNYYLSEYESQGKKFYKREDVFFKCLYEYYYNKNIEVNFLNIKFSCQHLFNIIRVYTVFLYRLFKDIKNESKEMNLEDNSKVDLRYIVRSYSQAQYLKNLIKRNGFFNEIIVMNNFLGISNFANINKLYSDCDNVIVKSFLPSNKRKIFKLYFKNLLNIFRVKNEYIYTNGVKINITQSVKEILVMYSELLIYENVLSEGINKLDKTKFNVLFSLEQKSPHAYIDALIARKEKSYCVQLMQCDQDDMVIPYPIVGDLFIPLSRKKSEIFSKVWQEDGEKIFFPGRLELPLKDVNAKYKLCYFSSFNNDEEYNINIVKKLIDIAKKNRFEFLIKLHPRDNGKWINQFNNETSTIFYKDNEIEKSKLYDLFEIAVGSFSAVFMDLLERKKKYIILNLGNFNININNIHYVDKLYKVIVEKIEDLDYWIVNNDLLDNEFKLFYNRYIQKSGDSYKSNDYLKKIIKRLEK